jgi:hypothetical protein
MLERSCYNSGMVELPENISKTHGLQKDLPNLQKLCREAMVPVRQPHPHVWLLPFPQQSQQSGTDQM